MMCCALTCTGTSFLASCNKLRISIEALRHKIDTHLVLDFASALLQLGDVWLYGFGQVCGLHGVKQGVGISFAPILAKATHQLMALLDECILQRFKVFQEMRSDLLSLSGRLRDFGGC